MLRDCINLTKIRTFRLAVSAYLAFTLVLGVIGFYVGTPLEALVAYGFAILAFPPVEYLTHRYVLHSLLLCRLEVLAPFWIRVHFAHHMDPDEPEIILAHPFSFALLLATLSLPVALLRPTALPFYLSAIFALFCFYEVVHFSAHSKVPLHSRYLQRRKRLHAIHHFNDEKVDYGISFSIMDHLLGTYQANIQRGQSPSVKNLGYSGATAARWPWVMREYRKRYLGGSGAHDA